MTWSWANTDITLPRSSFMSVSFLWLLPKCAQTAIAIDKLDAKETILHRRESNAEKGLQGGEGCFQFNIWVTFQTENRKDGHGCEVAKPYQEERSQSTSWLWGIQFERVPGGGGGITVGFSDQKNNITDPGLWIQTILQVTQLSTPLAASVPNFFTSSCYTTTSGPLSSPSSPSMSITHIEWNIKLKTDWLLLFEYILYQAFILHSFYSCGGWF